MAQVFSDIFIAEAKCTNGTLAQDSNDIYTRQYYSVIAKHNNMQVKDLMRNINFYKMHPMLMNECLQLSVDSLGAADSRAQQHQNPVISNPVKPKI